MRTRREPLPGVAARWEADCPRCGFQIHVGDRVGHDRGVPVHCECVGGGEGE